jgi:1-acyl-sn-glycerol-3-phosphate acyltransferase
MMKYPYICYQYLIAWPLFTLITLFTAIMTIIWMAWPNSCFIHAIQAFWSRSFFYLMFLPVEVTGMENIKKGQSYVFVSNHQSFCDVFLIYGWLPVIFKFLMKQELRKIPFVGTACEVCGHVYIDRRNLRAAVKSLRKVEQTLKDGVCTVIFPEGTRSVTGEVQPFKRGAFQVALHLHLPVIPLSLTGCSDCMPKGAKSISRHPVRMHIGKPMDLSVYEGEQEAINAVHQAVVEGLTA